MTFQVLPPLSDEDYEALKADIAERGVLVPVEYDQNGEILDGHHRVKACQELGISKWPAVLRHYEDDAERRSHARKLNLARRHLNAEQRRQIISDELKEAPERSNRAIAGEIGVSKDTVREIRSIMESTGEISQLTKTVGADGKARKATLPPRPKQDHSSHEAEVTELLRAWDAARRSAKAAFLKIIGAAFPDAAEGIGQNPSGRAGFEPFLSAEGINPEDEADRETAQAALEEFEREGGATLEEVKRELGLITAADLSDAEDLGHVGVHPENGGRPGGEGREARGVDPPGGNGVGAGGGEADEAEAAGRAAAGMGRGGDLDAVRPGLSDYPDCPRSMLRDPNNPLARAP